jgi:hypothetical protein
MPGQWCAIETETLSRHGLSRLVRGFRPATTTKLTKHTKEPRCIMVSQGMRMLVDHAAGGSLNSRFP